MKKNNFFVVLLSLIILLNSCGKFAEGMGGSKRSKSGDEFLVNKKKSLVVPPDFDDIPTPKQDEKTNESVLASETSIEDLLNVKKEENNNANVGDNSSLEQSILKKIKNN